MVVTIIRETLLTRSVISGDTLTGSITFDRLLTGSDMVVVVVV